MTSKGEKEIFPYQVSVLIQLQVILQLLMDHWHVKKKKLTSIVWNDFEKVIVDGQDYTICKHCKWKLKVDSKNGIKNLHVHLDRCIKWRNVDIKQQLLVVERKDYGKVQIGGFTFD